MAEDFLGGLARATRFIGDDVSVGDDVALAVEHEAGALGAPTFAAEDRADRDHAGRGFAEDPRRVKAVLGGLHGHLRRRRGDGRRLARGVVIASTAASDRESGHQREQSKAATF